MNTTIVRRDGPRGRRPWQRARRSPPDGRAAGGGAVYGLGMIGALAYFIVSGDSARDYALALPKVIFWPALLVYKLFRSLPG